MAMVPDWGFSVVVASVTVSIASRISAWKLLETLRTSDITLPKVRMALGSCWGPSTRRAMTTMIDLWSAHVEHGRDPTGGAADRRDLRVR